MLTVLRRGPASIAKPLISASTRPACNGSLPAHRARQIIPSPTTSLLSHRTFRVSLPCHQRSAEAAALGEEEVEVELEQEVLTQKPPSDAQIYRAVENGPVTKFKELGDRNMVCGTVVDTLTQDMRMETMTQVQSMTINESLKGIDMYVCFQFSNIWIIF